MSILNQPILNKISNGLQSPILSKTFPTGKNIFNKKNITKGYVIIESGITSPVSGFYCSGFIPVFEQANIVFSKVTSTGTAGTAFYDINKNYINGSFISNLDIISAGKSLTVPANAVYMRISNSESESIDTLQIEYGKNTTSYEEFDSIPKLPSFLESQKVILESMRESSVDNTIDFGSNLFNKKEDQIDVSINNSGLTIPLVGYATSQYIFVNITLYNSLKFLFRASVSSEGLYRIIFYRRDFSPILESYKENIPIGSTIDIPEDAYSFRFTHRTHTNGYDCVVNYANRNISWFDLRYTGPAVRVSDSDSKSDKYNLFDGVYLLKDYRIDYATGLPVPQLNCACTELIPVNYSTRYFISNMIASNSNWVIHFYDSRKVKIDSQYYTGFITTPANCSYVAINYTNPTDGSYSNTPFYLIDAKKWNNVIGDVIAENDDVIASKTGKSAPISDMRIAAVYENHVLLQAYSSGSFFYSSTGWTGSFSEVQLTSANFPSLQAGSTVLNAVFFNTNAGVRCLLLMSGNQIYSSTTGVFEGFVIPNIWDLPNKKHWRASDTDKDPTGQRYRAYFPSDLSNRAYAFSWHNGPVWFDGIGGQYSRGLCFANYTDAYAETKPVQSCLFYTEDGKNIYIQYEFGVYQKYYKTSVAGSVLTSVTHSYGDELNASLLGVYSGGLSVKKRWNILPSDGNKDPLVLFEYSNEVEISSISGSTMTLADASSISVGDVVIITGSASEFDKIINNSASGTVGGNAAFVVKSKSGNNITLADAIGNLNNNLMCRHIHGVNDFGNGIVIYTGEEYPESYFIYINPALINTNDGYNMNNSQWFSDVVRLNSGAKAHQRSLGVFLRSDGKCITIADSNNPRTAKLTVRDKSINMGNYGIHVFNLADIDDASKSISKIQSLNAGYALYFIGGILFYSDYKGITYYSKDEGDTWEYVCTDGTQKSNLVGFDKNKRRFYFNNVRGTHFVIEVK